MLQSAIDQSVSRLRVAQQSAKVLFNAKSYEEQEDAWRDYLLAVNGIYSKLEQGAKSNGKSTAWFGRKAHERKKDPLLTYLKFARNADEHGLVRVTARTPHNQTEYIKPNYNERRKLTGQKIDKVTGRDIGETFDCVIVGARVKCTRATDTRFNDFRDPPTHHLGLPIVMPEFKSITANDYVDILAITALNYMEEMINEARLLVV